MERVADVEEVFVGQVSEGQFVIALTQMPSKPNLFLYTKHTSTHLFYIISTNYIYHARTSYRYTKPSNAKKFPEIFKGHFFKKA